MSEEPTRGRQRASRARRARRHRVSLVGVLGELLITAGMLVFLFLGWQLWLNDIIEGNRQNESAAELGETWSSGNTPIIEDEAPEVDYGEPIVGTAPAEGKPFAIMYIPRFGSDWMRTISEGTSLAAVLNKNGVGHYGTTQMPGAVGNFAVAAHRTTYGAPFGSIAELEVGDRIFVRTPEAYYTYVFRNREYVSPRGVGVLDPVPQFLNVDPQMRLLTMTSCNPKFSAAERIIAYAVLESWQPVSAGAPAEIAPIVTAKG